MIPEAQNIKLILKSTNYQQKSKVLHCTGCPARLCTRGENPVNGHVLILAPPGDHLIEICYLKDQDRTIPDGPAAWRPATAQEFYRDSQEIQPFTPAPAGAR